MNIDHPGYREFLRVRSILNGTTPVMTASAAGSLNRRRAKPRAEKPASEQWVKIVNGYVETGMSKSAAVRQLIKDFPELRQQFCKDLTEEAARRRQSAREASARHRPTKVK